MKRRPTLGRPSLATAVHDLWAQGRSAAEIAAAAGTAPGHVRRALRSRGVHTPCAVRVCLPGETAGRLATAAGRRGTDVRALALAILETVARDDLFAAVLDTEDAA